MPRILVVDSNPKALNEHARAKAGEAAGEGYTRVLMNLRADVETVIVAPYDGDTAPRLDGFDGAVFTGSAVDWNTDDARAKPLAEVMRAAFAAGLPVLGSCNGMQLAASVLGGSSDASPNGREDGLARDIALTEAGRSHPMMAGRKDGYAVPCVHRDEVVRLPEGALRLAGNAHSAVQAMVHEREGLRFWGMQYHPECTPGFIGDMLQANGRIDAARADDLRRAETCPDAADRLGTRCEDMRDTGRTLEIRNWLAQLDR